MRRRWWKWHDDVGWWLSYHLRPVPWRSPWWCIRVIGDHHPVNRGKGVYWCPRCGEIVRPPA